MASSTVSSVARFGILAAFNGEDREIRNPRVKMMVDDVRFIRDTAREAHGSLTALVDHMDILKAKVAPDDPLAAVKRDITRLAPHLDLKTVEILGVLRQDAKRHRDGV